MKKIKSNMYLVTDKKVTKKYDTLRIIQVDESVFEFKLNEYDASVIDNEWFEVAKKDDTVMQWFAMGNIMRVTFTSSKAKVSLTEITPLMPVA